MASISAVSTSTLVSEAYAYAGTVGSAVNPFLEEWEVVLGVGILNVRLKLRVLASKVQPATE
jgi:hypothetical protein